MTTIAPGRATAPVRRGAVRLDPSQAAVLGLPDARSAAVLGAPGTGKTTTIVELVAERVHERGWSPDSILAIGASRATATRLRDAIALRLGVPTSGPMARTAASLAFEIVSHAARLAGAPPPRLLTGGEQDLDLAGILEGHIQEGTGPAWPQPLGPEVRRLRGFRTELRDLMMRATEFDVSPGRLAELGRVHGRPEWVASAAVMDEYYSVIGSYRGSQLDPAELARFAVAAIHSNDPGRVGELRLVIVDDLQEATESTLAILRALSARGITVIAFGDPDVAANAFRGGEPDSLGRLATVLGDPGLQTLTLSTVHRHGGDIRELVSTVTGRIGAAAAGIQRSARSEDAAVGTAAVSTIEAATPAREWATIARVLRERHLMDGVPWGEMGVIVRSGANVGGVARALALAEVPTHSVAGGTALRDDPTALSLLRIVEVGIGRTRLTPEVVCELLLGPLCGLDRMGLRKLRLALRAEELAGGGNRPSDELLVEAMSAPNFLATIDHRIGRTAVRLAGTLDLLRRSDGTIEDLLWLAWDRSGVARTWRDQALGTGILAAEANRKLDGVLALFTAAKRFAERSPERPPSDFLADVLDAEVPEDALAPARSEDAVLVTTPSGAVGLELDTVVVAAVQDGSWPNLRPRGSLLAPQQLVRAVTGVDSVTLDERRFVLDDELRMFALAVSRAKNRVVVAAVTSDDESPSVFFSLLPGGAARIDPAAATALSLRSMTGVLRRQLADPRSGDGVRSSAASALARLAELRVPGADPAEWHGLIEQSSTGPLFDGELVPVLPSKLERIEESPLDWFIETIGGSPAGVAANVGTVLHWAMETTSEPTVDALWASVQSRWSELVFESPWLAERQQKIAKVFTTALAEYLTHFERDGKALVGAERRFSVEVGNAVVSGSIDRVERAPDGSVVIVDLKTGSPVTSQAAVDWHPQLGAYQLAYASGVLDEHLAEHGEHQPGGAKLLFVKEGKGGRLYRESIQAVLDDDGLEAVRERIRTAATIIAAAEFHGSLELPQWGGFGENPRLRLHRVRAVSSD